jgi:hypothetical protein
VYGRRANTDIIKTLLKKLSSLLAEKWEKPYSVVCGYVSSNEHCHCPSYTPLLERLSYSY